MNIIQTVDAQRFALDGIQYFKNFLSFVAGNRICIYNVYDRRDERLEFVLFNEIELDGIIYPSAAALQSALLPVIYTRDTLGDLIPSIPFYNKFIVVTGYTLVGQDITFNPNWQWLINGNTYTNPGAVVINIPFADTGKSRIDIIVANAANTFVRITGIETAGTPAAPPRPAGVLDATFLIITDDGIEPIQFVYGEYQGTFNTLSDFQGSRERFGIYGDFVFILNPFQIGIHNGSDFLFYSLDTVARDGLLKLKAKGYKGGVINSGAGIEVGDFVFGIGKTPQEFWDNARYHNYTTDGDTQNRNNYEFLAGNDFEAIP